MILIHRTSASQPKRWATTTAPSALVRLTRAVQQHGGHFDRSDVKSSTFKTARAKLTALQNDKCCYCEGTIDASYADVEHFRPMSLYWWLAYDWDNLLVACKYCNQTAKGAHFAVFDEARRLSPGMRPPQAESPKLLDPADKAISIEDHIVYREDKDTRRWVPIARDGSEHGQYTIDLLRLDRDRNLAKRREDEANAAGWLAVWRAAKQRGDAATTEEVLHQVEDLCRPNCRYLAMKRAIFREILEAEQP